jgi:DNA-binding transcriptional ArsR family regulator
MAGSTDPSGRLPDALAARMAETMFALSTPSRLQILVCLRDGPRTVSEIVGAVDMEQSAVSHQLRVLREHAVVTVRRLGRTRQYALRNEHIEALIDDALAHLRALERPELRATDLRVRGDASSAAS